jgi:hypothetical protein
MDSLLLPVILREDLRTFGIRQKFKSLPNLLPKPFLPILIARIFAMRQGFKSLPDCGENADLLAPIHQKYCYTKYDF